MQMDGQRESDNVEDRRSGGGGGGISFGGGGVGLGTIVIAVIAGWIFGINPLTIIGALSGGGSVVSAPAPQSRAPAAGSQGGASMNDAGAVFVRKVLASTEDVWHAQMRAAGRSYRDPKLVMFRGATRTACGTGQTAMGPFYCPGDETVYIDLDFFDTMQRQLHSPGDFPRAYVIAHEVGHHVQEQLGITEKVDSMRSRISEAQANALSVRVELMADCLAGVWATNAQKQQGGWRLESGDVQEALNAAAQIGDDTLQRKSMGTIVPESFTHGTSQQRQTWLERGLQTGDVNTCLQTFDRAS